MGRKSNHQKRIEEIQSRGWNRMFTTLAYFMILIMIIGIIVLTMASLNSKDIEKDIEENCNRISINEFEDNCFCKCDEPNWIERKLRLGTLCDGWIVNKNESCIYGVEHFG